MTLKTLIQQEEQPKTKVALKEKTKSFLKLPQTQQEMVLTTAVEYEILNQQEKLLAARRNLECRPIVEAAAEKFGIEDNNGHLHLQMGDTEIVRTKKISTTINSILAEELLKEKGLYESCITPVVTYEFSEEKIIEAYNAGKISAIELDSIFTEKISWATSVNTDNEEVQTIKELRKQLEKTKKGELPEIGSS